MDRWLSIGGEWGTREQAIPGEWAMLMLIIVLGALLGLVVLWFTLLRHERTLRARERRRAQSGAASATESRLTGIAMVGIGSAADEPAPVAAQATQTLVAEDDAAEEPGAEEPVVVGAAPPEEAPAEQPPNSDDAAITADAADVANIPAAADEDDAPKLTGAGAQRKLTDEILSRVESELAERDAPRWKDMAALVQDEFGVSVHPSSIQKAVKRRRRAHTTQTA